MSAITAKGSQAKENANKKNRPDLKKVLLKLKDGDSHKVRLLSTEDYVEYSSAGDFNLGIYTQAISPDSPLLVAHAKGGEKFKGLYKKSRYNFVFASIETGELVALQVSKNQAKTLIKSIDEYADHISTVAFKVTRSGDDTSTVYTLNPMLGMNDKEKEMFAKFDGQEVEMEFYEAVLEPKSDDFLAKLLKEAGFDVETHLPHINISDDAEEGTEPTEDAEPITEDGEENPLDVI